MLYSVETHKQSGDLYLTSEVDKHADSVETIYITASLLLGIVFLPPLVRTTIGASASLWMLAILIGLLLLTIITALRGPRDARPTGFRFANLELWNEMGNPDMTIDKLNAMFNSAEHGPRARSIARSMAELLCRATISDRAIRNYFHMMHSLDRISYAQERMRPAHSAHP